MRKDSRITVLVAIATFLTLSLIAGIVYAVTRPAAKAEAKAEAFARIAIDDFKPLADSGAVRVIDVRASGAYLASHIPGAMHIPLSRLEGELPYLQKGKRIVTYCTCPAEESSGEAALLLQRFGFEAAALLGGFDSWTGRGFPTATGVK
jgi:rhodanese-related sulfurtransferase